MLTGCGGDSSSSSDYTTTSVATSVDSDLDGVSDSQDQCPNTSIGESVDEYGCSKTQHLTWYRDADADNYGDPYSSTAATTLSDMFLIAQTAMIMIQRSILERAKFVKMALTRIAMDPIQHAQILLNTAITQIL
jgi:hypothetical protein